MWPICLAPAGHGARVATVTTLISAVTSEKRTSRNLSGGAYGNPYFAAMNPVLQSTTNRAGNSGLARLIPVPLAATREPARIDDVCKRCDARSTSLLLFRRPVTLDAVENLALRFLGTDPAGQAHPLARLEILVMLEEMRDLRELDLRQVARRFDRPVQRRQFVGGNGEDFGITARLVVHLQHADRTAPNDNARDQWHRRQHEHVARVAVIGQCLRYIAVVARIMHRRRHEPVDENRTACLVHFVLDRLAMHRDL